MCDKRPSHQQNLAPPLNYPFLFSFDWSCGPRSSVVLTAELADSILSIAKHLKTMSILLRLMCAACALSTARQIARYVFVPSPLTLPNYDATRCFWRSLYHVPAEYFQHRLGIFYDMVKSPFITAENNFATQQSMLILKDHNWHGTFSHWGTDH